MQTNRKTNTYQPKHRARSGAVLGFRRKISAILVLAGVLLFAYSVWGTALYQDVIPAPSVSLASNKPAPKPVQISIPAINLTAQVADVGLNANQTLQTPSDSSQVGWFTGSPAPGAQGPAVMVGHLDTVFGPAIFWHLADVHQGDQIQVKRDDGSVATFEILETDAYPQDNFPSDKVYGAINYAGLRLITCSGTYSRIAGHYSDNLVVYASLVSVN